MIQLNSFTILVADGESSRYSCHNIHRFIRTTAEANAKLVKVNFAGSIREQKNGDQARVSVGLVFQL